MEQEIIEVNRDGQVIQMWSFVYYAMLYCKGVKL